MVVFSYSTICWIEIKKQGFSFKEKYYLYLGIFSLFLNKTTLTKVT